MPPTIAILHYAGPPGIGGVEATIAAHTRLLADKGYQIRLIVGTGSLTDQSAELLVQPLLSSRHPQIEAISAELSRGEISPAFNQIVEQLTTDLTEALAGCDVAIVHNVTTLHKNLAFTAALANIQERATSLRFISWAHDFAWAEPMDLPQLHIGWPWSLLREPWPGMLYVTVSEHRRRILASLLGLAVPEITVVPPGVDVARLLKLGPATVALVEQFDLLAADPLLLLPARITRHKNVELALQIVSKLRDHMPAPRLVITGPPDPHNLHNAIHLAELHALRAELEAPAIFLYESFPVTQGGQYLVDDAMIADWLSLADGLLFPSITEGFGIPVIEGALRGARLFCSDISAFREIAGDYVLRFGLNDPPAAIAERIAHALRDDPRHALRVRVRQRFTWEAIYQQTINPLLRQVMSPGESLAERQR